MELHQSRLATSGKLRAEWDRRLDRNAMSIDVLNSNRSIWLAAGGAEPETLASPSETALEYCTKTVEVLHAMLQKYGPKGGLDSHTQEIEEAGACFFFYKNETSVSFQIRELACLNAFHVKTMQNTISGGMSQLKCNCSSKNAFLLRHPRFFDFQDLFRRVRFISGRASQPHETFVSFF